MKHMILMVLTAVCFMAEPCQWDQYLGNPGRTGYSTCRGPHSPEILWEIELPGYADTPFIVEDKVMVLCKNSPAADFTDSGIAVVDLLTGTLLEKNMAGVHHLTGAYPAGDLVLGTTGGGRLYRIDPVSGTASFDILIPYKRSYTPHRHPVILTDRVIFPTIPAVCLSRNDYTTLWNLQLSLGSLYPENGVTQNIAASADRIFVVLEGEDTRIWAVDPNTGEFIWVSDPFPGIAIAADESFVFVDGDDLYALDAGTGELLWSFEIESPRSNIMVGPDAVYLTDTQNYLYAVDKNTGVLKWKSPWQETTPFWITYIVGAGDTIVCSNVLNLTSFSAEDGTVLWNIHSQNFIDVYPDQPCPAVTDNILVFVKRITSPYVKLDRLIALSSDPDVFVKQGDAFLSEGLASQALSSYEKAAGLYEKEGDLNRAQEVQEKIHELKKLEELRTPEPSSPAPSKSVPEYSVFFIALGIAILVAALLGIFAVYHFARSKDSRE